MTLIDRLSKLDGPDRVLDTEIAMQLLGFSRVNRMMRWPEEKPIWDFYEGDPLNSNGVLIPRYTASVDAALALAERLLPGWKRQLLEDYNGKWIARICSQRRELFSTDYLRGTENGGSPNPAIALCIALLRAKEASKP